MYRYAATRMHLWVRPSLCLINANVSVLLKILASCGFKINFDKRIIGLKRSTDPRCMGGDTNPAKFILIELRFGVCSFVCSEIHSDENFVCAHTHTQLFFYMYRKCFWHSWQCAAGHLLCGSHTILLGQVPQFQPIEWKLNSSAKKNKLQVECVMMVYSSFIDWMMTKEVYKKIIRVLKL